MRTFQRYGLWILGWLLVTCSIALLVSTFDMIMRQARSDVDMDLIEYVKLSVSAFGYVMTTLATGLLCLFAARICKLETDPTFKAHLSALFKVARTAGDKSKLNLD